MKYYSISYNGSELCCVKAKNEEDALLKAGIYVQKVEE